MTFRVPLSSSLQAGIPNRNPMDSNRGPDKPGGIERRRAPRISDKTHPSLPGRVNFSVEKVEGEGLLHDLSVTGAQVAEVTLHLQPGTLVALYFLEEETQRRMRAVGEVVRETDSGFALRFVRVERELERLVLSAVSKAEETEE